MRFLLLLLLFSTLCLHGQADQIHAIYRSTDAGDTWVPFDEGMPETAFVSEVIDHHGTLYAATDGHGVFALLPGEEEWAPRNNGFVGTVDINALAARGDLLVVGTYRNGIYLSRNGGKRWQRPIFNVPNISVTTLLMTPKTIFAGTDRSLYVSVDDGNTWVERNTGSQVNDLFFFDGRLYAARTDGLVVSTDLGATWEHLYAESTVGRIEYYCPYLYAYVYGGVGWIRKIDGSTTWENPYVRLPIPQSATLMSALWTGLNLKGTDEIPFRNIFATPIGWLAAGSPGC